LLSASNDSIKSSTANLNVSQQTDETKEENQVSCNDKDSLNNAIQFIKEQFDIIKNNKNSFENEINLSKRYEKKKSLFNTYKIFSKLKCISSFSSTASDPENEKLLDLFKYIEESFKRVNENNYTNQAESKTNSTENYNQPDNNIMHIKCLTLEESLKEMEEDYEKRLNISEQKLEKINIEYDNLSLQTKIVSLIYF